MISRTIETFEVNEVESKLISDFQDFLLQMNDCAVKKETQSKIESIYNSILTLIPQV